MVFIPNNDLFYNMVLVWVFVGLYSWSRAGGLSRISRFLGSCYRARELVILWVVPSKEFIDFSVSDLWSMVILY